MAERSNIEWFDELSGEILATLYESFPVPKHLLSKDFVENPEEYNEIVQADVASKEARFFIATVEWLREAGYLRADPQNGHYNIARDCVLSAKGLEVLKVKPSSLDVTESFGDRLIAATRQSGTDALRKAASDVLSLGARFVFEHTT